MLRTFWNANQLSLDGQQKRGLSLSLPSVTQAAAKGWPGAPRGRANRSQPEERGRNGVGGTWSGPVAVRYLISGPRRSCCDRPSPLQPGGPGRPGAKASWPRRSCLLRAPSPHCPWPCRRRRCPGGRRRSPAPPAPPAPARPGGSTPPSAGRLAFALPHTRSHDEGWGVRCPAPPLPTQEPIPAAGTGKPHDHVAKQGKGGALGKRQTKSALPGVEPPPLKRHLWGGGWPSGEVAEATVPSCPGSQSRLSVKRGNGKSCLCRYINANKKKRRQPKTLHTNTLWGHLLN